MKKLITVVIILLFVKAGMAQAVPTFSKLFGIDSAISGGTAITSSADTIFFCMYTNNSTSTYQAATIVKVDSIGNIVRQFEYEQPNSYYYGGRAKSLKAISNGDVLWASDSFTASTPAGAFLCKFHSSLDTPSRWIYNPIGYSEFYSCAELSDGDYLMAGTIWDSLQPGQSSAWMLKTDTQGNVIWQKPLSSDVLNWASYTSPFNGGFYQFWETTNENISINSNGDSAIFVDRYDNNGNLQWRDTFGFLGSNNLPGPFTSTLDGGGALFLNTLDTSTLNQGSSFNMPAVLYRFDSTGSVIWRRYFPPAAQYLYVSGMIESHSGDIVICGSVDSGYISISSQGVAYPAIVKFDKDGNLIFFRYYNSSGGDALNDITQTSDGGYACIGNGFHQVGGQNVQAAWLLKVDSNGCLNGDCPTLYTGIKPIADLTNFFVFPNPASSQFTVALAGPNDIYQYHDLTFSLYDLTGRLVIQQLITAQTTLIQRGDLADGLYIWSLNDQGNQLRNGKMVFK